MLNDLYKSGPISRQNGWFSFFVFEKPGLNLVPETGTTIGISFVVLPVAPGHCYDNAVKQAKAASRYVLSDT
jgi:hypothetical protein